MSESLSYLGIVPAHRVNNVTTPLVGELIQAMQSLNILQISGVHRVPSIRRNNPHIIHPAIGARGKEYAGFQYVDTPFELKAKIPGAAGVEFPVHPHASNEQLRVILRPAGEEIPVGIPAYRPEHVTLRQEFKVKDALVGAVGYNALVAQVGPTLDDGRYPVEVFGTGDNEALESLPFNEKMANTLMVQTCYVLLRDLEPQLFQQ